MRSRTRRTTGVLCASALAVAALAAPAAGESTAPVPAAGTAATTPATSPKPKPPARVGGAMRFSLLGPTRLGRERYLLTHRAVRVRGTVSRWAPGQQVVIKLWQRARVVRTVRARVVRSASGRFGHFTVRFAVHRAGRFAITAIKRGTPRQVRMSAGPSRAIAITGSAGFGRGGPEVAALQDGLARLGYWTPGGASYGAGTGRAVLAYRKVNWMARTQSSTRHIVDLLLQGRGGFRARRPDLGRHVEADLARQVLVFLYGRKVHAVFAISSGKPSTPTVLGTFRFYAKDPGTNSHGMVHSSYFFRGYAVHGYAEVPPYAASHGCLRTWIPNSWAIYRWIRIGEPISVYR